MSEQYELSLYQLFGNRVSKSHIFLSDFRNGQKKKSTQDSWFLI